VLVVMSFGALGAQGTGLYSLVNYGAERATWDAKAARRSELATQLVDMQKTHGEATAQLRSEETELQQKQTKLAEVRRELELAIEQGTIAEQARSEAIAETNEARATLKVSHDKNRELRDSITLLTSEEDSLRKQVETQPACDGWFDSLVIHTLKELVLSNAC